MSVVNDLNTMTKMAGKGVYHDAKRIDMYTGYVLMLMLMANDEVAATKSREKSHLYTEDYLHSPTYQYCVEAAKFISDNSLTTRKKSVMFYVSSVLFMHRFDNPIEHWKRVNPKEINAPKVRRMVAKAFALDDEDKLTNRTHLPSIELSYCLASFLEVHPDTYDSIWFQLPLALTEAYPDVDRASAKMMVAMDNVLPEDTAARRRVWMQLALFTPGVSMSIAAECMIKGLYKDNLDYEMGKQEQIVIDLIEHECMRRNLLYTEKDFEELREKGFPVVGYGDTIDLTKLYEEAGF